MSDLAVIDVEVVLSNRDLDMIRRQVNIPRGGRPPTDMELDDFARYCMANRLNPFDRQIYLAHIGGRWQPFTGVHGRLVIALRSGEVDGMEGPFYCRKREGIERDQPPHWDELWDDAEPPHAAKFVVYRKGWTRWPVGIAPWRYYNKGTPSWQSNPPLMLGYKAITRALNLVFPDVMPPSPDRADDEPDIDETTGYARTVDDTAAGTYPPAPADSQLVDARGLAAEFNLTAGALLVDLRRCAAARNLTLPTSLDAVPIELVTAWRGEQGYETPDNVEEPT
jgi:hypothetical protein